jgi:pimeloyl-ACP methyl ester carboxylesterase
MQQTLTWTWQNWRIEIGFELCGSGPIVLMLPALSSISTRGEMRPLADLLASEFTCVAVDMPGFGTLPRPAVVWTPDAYRSFLTFLLTHFSNPLAVIAAGHTAGYLIAHAADYPGTAGRLCLIAPTWRGPFPTMMGRRHPAFKMISRLVDFSLLGPALYRLNVNRPMIRMMSSGHVYSDPSWLNEIRFAEKLQVTNASGARHSSFRFVAGELDPFTSRDEFLKAARRVEDPVLVLYGSETPSRSMAEMKELVGLPNVLGRELPSGKLAVHEEFPSEVSAAVREFLAGARVR